MNPKTKPSEAVEALISHLEELTEAADKNWLDNVEDAGGSYGCCLEDTEDQIIKDFRGNYRSKGIGFEPFDHLTGDEIADALLKSMPAEEFAGLVLKHCSVADCDYYVQWNEMASVQIGEMEYQIDVEEGTELKTLVDACTEAELKSIRHYGSGAFLVYGNPCSRIIWKLDPETFLEAVAPMLRAAGLVDPDEAAADA